MTKIKKRLALLMALVMAMTMLALPASAATGEDEVAPCGAVVECVNCGGECSRSSGETKSKVYMGEDEERVCHVPAHYHTKHVPYTTYICTSCGCSYTQYSTTYYTCDKHQNAVVG